MTTELVRDFRAELGLAADHAGPISLLLTDVIMPGLNGKELMDLVAETRPGIKVIFMSGYIGDIISKRGFLDPETNFLQKPFRIMDLACKVREVLDSKQPSVSRA